MAGLRPRGSPEMPDLVIKEEIDSGRIDSGKTTGTRPTAPELDLNIPAPAPSRPSLSGPGPSGRSALDDMEDDEANQPSLSLEIDTSGSAPLPPAISKSIPVPAGPTSARSLPPTGVPAPGAGDRTSMPGPTPDGPIAVDPYDARALADYEPVPDAFYMTPFYALKVLTRRGVLRIELDEAREKNARASNEALDALVSLGERLVPLAGRGLEQVQAAEQVLRARDGALASEMDAHNGRLAEMDARLQNVEQEVATAEAAVVVMHTELEEARAGKARVEAKAKRAEIEMRNAEAVGTELDLRPSQAGDQELARANALLAAAEGRSTEARRKCAAVEARAAAVRQEQKSETDRFQRQLRTRSAGFAEARDGYRNALADLARQLLGSASGPPELEPLRKDAVGASERAHKANVDLRLHEVGIDSYDRGKVALGIALACALAFLLLLLVLFPFIYRSFVVS